MKGESHSILSILITLPIALALYNFLPADLRNGVFFMLGGVMLGCLFPDVDASDAKIMHGSWKPVGLVGKYLFYYPMTKILGLKSDSYSDMHRGYLHSLVGCLLVSCFFAIPFVGVFLLTYESSYAWMWVVLWLGIPIGFLLHLYEDSFTKSGVKWLFPRDNIYSGQVSTGRKSERVIVTLFVFVYGSLAIVSYIFVPSLIWVVSVAVLSVLLMTVFYRLHPKIILLGNIGK